MNLAALPTRFQSKVRVADNGCWLWMAAKINGYGRYGQGRGRHVAAHRFSYETLIGAIPSGLEIDHLCLTKHCVNPAHLEPVTHSENIRRAFVNGQAKGQAQPTKGLKMVERRNSHCPQGHDLSVHGLEKPGHGWRCKLCHRDRERERYRTKIAEARVNG